MHKKTVKRIFINDSMPDAHLVLSVVGSIFAFGLILFFLMVPDGMAM